MQSCHLRVRIPILLEVRSDRLRKGVVLAQANRLNLDDFADAEGCTEASRQTSKAATAYVQNGSKTRLCSLWSRKREPAPVPRWRSNAGVRFRFSNSQESTFPFSFSSSHLYIYHVLKPFFFSPCPTNLVPKVSRIQDKLAHVHRLTILNIFYKVRLTVSSRSALCNCFPWSSSLDHSQLSLRDF